MSNMPDKPETWALVLAWLSQHAPVLYATGLSFVMAAIRIIYGAAPVARRSSKALFADASR